MGDLLALYPPPVVFFLRLVLESQGSGNGAESSLSAHTMELQSFGEGEQCI